MKHGKIIVPKDKEVRRQLYIEALQNSYIHWIDALKKGKTARERTDRSFIEVLEVGLNERAAHWTILFRDKLDEYEDAHWEFGVSTKVRADDEFIWISVRIELAEKIFSRFGLEIQWY